MADGANPVSINPLWLCTSGRITSSYQLPHMRGGYWEPWNLEFTMTPTEAMLVSEGPLYPSFADGYFGSAWGTMKGQWTCLLQPKYSPYNYDCRGWAGVPFDGETLANQKLRCGHNGGNNVGFADGHAKFMPLADMVAHQATLYDVSAPWVQP